MKIRAETKFKHGRLAEAIGKLGWSQSELARRCGLRATTVGLIINMRKKPSKYYADKIELALASAGITDMDIFSDWPDDFKCTHKIVQTQDIPESMLLTMEDNSHKLVSAYSGENIDIEYMMEKISELPEKNRLAIERVYFGDMTYKAFGNSMGRCRERAKQIVDESVKMITKVVNCEVIQENDANTMPI